MRTRQSAGTAIALTITVIGLSGCTHLLNPYVMPAELKPPGATSAGKPSYSDLPAARLEAYKYVAELGEAATEHSQLRNGTALALAPLAAISAYKGIASTGDGTKKIITKLTLGTAALFGMGEYFYSSPRQSVYFEGMKTGLCLIGSADTYLVSDSEYADFDGDVKSLTTAISKAKSATEDVEMALIDAKSDPYIARAKQYVKVAHQSIEDAGKVRKAGGALRAQMDRAGVDLRLRMARLSVDVAKETQKTEPDLASIKVTLASIAESVKPPQNVASATKASAPGGGKKDSGPIELSMPGPKNVQRFVEAEPTLQSLLNDLDDALETLVDTSDKVASFVNDRAGLGKQAATKDECKLAPASAFKVEPADDSRIADIPSTTLFSVSGGTGPVRATIAGTTQGDKVTAKPQLKDGFYGVVLQVEPEAKDGKVTLVISDGTAANHKSIEVTLKKTPKEAPKDPKTETPAPEPEITDVEQIKVIQAGVGLTGTQIDGKVGEVTRAAVKKYQAANSDAGPADGRLTKKLLDSVKKKKASNTESGFIYDPKKSRPGDGGLPPFGLMGDEPKKQETKK